MNITLIAAMAQNRVIGRDNDLIWHLPKDLQHFKSLTSGHHVIMGRKTFESMGKPLPKRTNIVISRKEDYTAEGCIVVKSLEEAIQQVKNDDQPFIIGGGQIYKQALSLAHTIELTEVYGDFEGDTFFPEIDEKIWEEKSRVLHKADEKNSMDMAFVTYEKL